MGSLLIGSTLIPRLLFSQYFQEFSQEERTWTNHTDPSHILRVLSVPCAPPFKIFIMKYLSCTICLSSSSLENRAQAKLKNQSFLGRVRAKGSEAGKDGKQL